MAHGHAVFRLTRIGDDNIATTNGPGCDRCLVFFMQPLPAVMPQFEDDFDPKRPRPVRGTKKGEGWQEAAESRKDDDRDHHRHVHVRC